ncbi:dihydroorotase [Flavobacteriaceae bacterium GF1]
MNVLLKSATIVAPGHKNLHLKKRDIHIRNGKIESINAKISVDGNLRVIERKNLHVSLGWFDSGVAFGEPGFEERETLSNGLDVASKSGFTEILLNTNTNPRPDTSSDIVFLKERSAKKSTVLYPLGNVTANGEGKALAELYDMHQAGAVAFYDFKSPIANANLMKIALQYAQNFQGLVFSYPLDKMIKGKGVANEGTVSTRLGLKGIPALAEELQIARDLYILEYTGGKSHIPTISTEGSVQLIAEAKKKGLDVSCSVALHNLALTDSLLEDFDSNYKVMPPLRTSRDTKALQKALLKGTIDFVTTDHTPLDIEEKRVEFDNAAYGTIGLESAFGALNSIFGMEKAVEILTRGRERFGLETPQMEKGSLANLSLFNPDGDIVFGNEHIHSTSKNSAFLGQQLKGHVYGVVNNGKINLA